jgi:hypothetical protein
MEKLMNKANGLGKRIKLRLLIGLFMALTGCIAGRGYYHDSIVVSEPDEYLFGGVYYTGYDAHHYSHRGHESRGAAHGGNHGGRR